MTENPPFPFSVSSFGISECGTDLDSNHPRTSCCLIQLFDNPSQQDVVAGLANFKSGMSNTVKPS